LEDINKDDSSIWMTSNQKVGITPSNRTSVSNISQFSNPQVIINSDRLIFNSKKDNIIISSKKDIAISTSEYTTTINLIISAIETLARGTFPVVGNATTAHPQIASILLKLKQGIG
jgi:hypothetical protein